MANGSGRFARVASLFFLLVALAGTVSAQGPANYKSSYYYQAYDQGFRAGRADYDAGRAPSYHAALITTAGLSAISTDYRNAFKTGYQDGYSSRRHTSDWYYRNHHHDGDCDEDDQGNGKWSCREHHDNGKHKGWYKHHGPKGKDKDRDEGDERD